MSAPEAQGGGHVRRVVVIAALVGLAVSIVIVVKAGFGEIAAIAINRIGWRGLLAMCATYLPGVAVLGAAWLVLDARARPSEWLTLFFARLVRDASGELLPFSSLGGFVFGARAAILGGMEPAMAISTTVVDVTAEFISQLGYAAVGLALLGAGPEALESQRLLASSLLGLAAGGIGAVAFIVFQHRASGFIEREVAKRAPSALAQTSAVTASVHALYEKPWRLIFSTVLHFIGWILGAVGVWGGLWLAGQHMSLRIILGLESLVYVVRTMTFAAPMGLGVIEAGYAAVAVLFGLPVQFAVALSLIKRVRDVLIGLPALALWQFLEGRRMLATGAKAEVLEAKSE